MKKLLKIDVRKTNIRKGIRSTPKLCPIALAGRRVSHKEVVVDGTYLSLTCGDEELSYTLPKKARRFVDRFDAGKPVKPFTFTARLEA